MNKIWDKIDEVLNRNDPEIVDGVPMLEGGICDASPIRKAVADGFDRNVVVLTRNKGYRKDEKEK